MVSEYKPGPDWLGASALLMQNMQNGQQATREGIAQPQFKKSVIVPSHSLVAWYSFGIVGPHKIPDVIIRTLITRF